VVVAYSERRTLTEAVLGSAVTYTYSLTGPYDPNITGAGVQPVGFDPWMTMYSAYRVARTRVEITFSNVNATLATIGSIPSNLNSLPSSIAAWNVDPFGWCKSLGSVGGNRGQIVMYRTYVPWQIMQIPRAQYMTDADYMGSAIANPARQLYLMVFTSGLSAVAVVDIVVRISYDMQLMLPVLQSVS